ncbi:hypothetical protein [Blastopirellula marina]|uniref:Uncharacterized protein n=1 Tax=Blastopirellula marina DSM 3645 TaxID=314230 RepID=A3ZZ17_9BACT|nr:hypothetical protein [Blastopirellula marina]EAQ78155.1 hypothetical protein DSM3645_15300 [Blastopirellula marina DSM 3645]
MVVAIIQRAPIGNGGVTRRQAELQNPRVVEHRRRLRTTNMPERLKQEIQSRLLDECLDRQLFVTLTEIRTVDFHFGTG